MQRCPKCGYQRKLYWPARVVAVAFYSFWGFCVWLMFVRQELSYGRVILVSLLVIGVLYKVLEDIGERREFSSRHPGASEQDTLTSQ